MSTISSPSIVQSISAKGNNISSTTNLTISLDTPNSNQVSGKITIKADGIMNTTGTLQASGNIMIDGKGSIEGNT
jgi:cytoskeletal protein CcmA (bactofilin family)